MADFRHLKSILGNLLAGLKCENQTQPEFWRDLTTAYYVFLILH
jgi:hypothetical protein